MVKRQIKQQLEALEMELKMNLSNNYKDLARDALEAYRQAVETCYQHGDLKEKDYIKYKYRVDTYANSMVGYHH
jgi:RIO-like serine/threonine protein kinase